MASSYCFSSNKSQGVGISCSSPGPILRTMKESEVNGGKIKGTTVLAKRRPDGKWLLISDSRLSRGEGKIWEIVCDNMLKASLPKGDKFITAIIGDVHLAEIVLGQVRSLIYKNRNASLNTIKRDVEAVIRSRLHKSGYDRMKAEEDEGADVLVLDRNTDFLLAITLNRNAGHERMAIYSKFLSEYAGGSGKDAIEEAIEKWLIKTYKSLNDDRMVAYNLMAQVAHHDRCTGGFCTVLVGAKDTKWHSDFCRELKSNYSPKEKKQDGRLQWIHGRRFEVRHP